MLQKVGQSHVWGVCGCGLIATKAIVSQGNLLKCTLKRTRGQILNEDRRSTPAEYAGTIRVPVRRPDHNSFKMYERAT